MPKVCVCLGCVCVLKVCVCVCVCVCVPKVVSVKQGSNEKGDRCRSTVGVKGKGPSTM